VRIPLSVEEQKHLKDCLKVGLPIVAGAAGKSLEDAIVVGVAEIVGCLGYALTSATPKLPKT
jgi:hypothetical protein